MSKNAPDGLCDFATEMREHERAAQQFCSFPVVRHLLSLVAEYRALKQRISSNLNSTILVVLNFVLPPLPETEAAENDKRTPDERIGPSTDQLQLGAVTLGYKTILINTPDGHYKINLDASHWTKHGFWNRRKHVTQVVAPDANLFQSHNGEWQQIYRPLHTGRSCPEAKLQLLRESFGWKDRVLLLYFLSILTILVLLTVAIRIQTHFNLL